MIEKGQDPKEYMIEVCRPECKLAQEKLQRCETALKNMSDADPELSCMYRLRDWVTCIDGCVLILSFRSNPKFMPNWSAMNLEDSSTDHQYCSNQKISYNH
jgi:hypothetical protein